tara:strand:+ start:2285 stop:2860 length:576 start_codon:yes stop_codon:yes gene_type:complete
MGMSETRDADDPSNGPHSNPYAAPKARIQEYIDSNAPRLAGRAIRFAAAILNVFIAIAMGVTAIVLMQLVVRGFEPDAAQMLGGSETIILLGAFLPWLLWNTYLIHTRSQSVGKMIMKIKVVAQDGGPAGTARQLLLRVGVTQVLSGLVPFFPLIDNLMIFTPDKRTIHDRIAGTIVIQAPRARQHRKRQD